MKENMTAEELEKQIFEADPPFAGVKKNPYACENYNILLDEAKKLTASVPPISMEADQPDPSRPNASVRISIPAPLFVSELNALASLSRMTTCADSVMFAVVDESIRLSFVVKDTWLPDKD